MKTILRSALAAALCAGLSSTAFADAPSAADVQAATAACDALVGAFVQGDFGSIWKGLPASYKTAASDAVKEFAGKMDPEVWKLGQNTLLQVAATVVKQNALIVGMDDGTSVPGGDSLTEAEKKALLVKGGAKLGAVARAATLEKLATGDLQGLLDTPALTMKGITDAVAAVKVPKSSAAANDDGSVTISNPANPGKTIRMVKAEGVWLPDGVVKAFEKKDEWKAAAAALEPLDAAAKQQATTMLGMVQSATKSAGKATNAEEFQQALMQGLFPILMMGGSMGGAMPGMGGGDAVPISIGGDED